METLLRGDDYAVIVLDSIASLLPKQELESDMEKASMGTYQSRLMSTALRRLTVANRKTCLVYINQMRDSIASIFAKRQVTSGGRAMSFYASTRIEMVRTDNIKRTVKMVDPKTRQEKQQEIIKGHRVLVRVEKDKTGGPPQGTTSSFVFDYDRGGIDPIDDLTYVAQVMGMVQRKGNKFWVVGYEDEKQIHLKKFNKWLRKNKAIAEELEEQVLEQLGV